MRGTTAYNTCQFLIFDHVLNFTQNIDFKNYVSNDPVESDSYQFKVKEQPFFSNNFILLIHIQVCFKTIYDGCLT